MDTFKKYLSYFNRIIVEETSSSYNAKLIVAIQNGKYVLNTANANYSFGSLHRVFQQTFQRISLSNKKISSCLLLGGGVGSVPSILHNELGLNLPITMVEIDQEVINLGNNYFSLNSYKNLTIIVDDALVYVTKEKEKYDLIVIDIFNGLLVPKQITSATFFENIKKLLTNNGTIIFNFVCFDFETKQEVKQIEQLLKTIFKKNYTVSMCKIESLNRVFIIERT